MRRHSLRSSINRPRKNSNQTGGAMQTRKGLTSGGGSSRDTKKVGENSSESSSVQWTAEMESPEALSSYYVREVWANDVEHELRLMEKLVENYPYIAVDGRFPGVVARPTGPFKNDMERNYEIIRTNMGLVKILQLSLSFANKDGEVAGHPEDVRTGNMRSQRPPGCVWKINFHFDVRRDMYCPEALDRLRLPLTRGGGGIDFKEHFRRGVSVETFSELITGSGLVMSPEVTWITVGGAFLFAGLVKMLTGCRELPTTEEEFSETCYEYFPHIWDMRVCRGCSPKCGMSPRIPLHACASEMAILEACGSSSARVTSPTLAMLEVFFRYVRFGGRATSAVDDCSVSSSTTLRSDSFERASMGKRGRRVSRRASQFGLGEFNALNIGSPAAILGGKKDVISWRVTLRKEIEGEYNSTDEIPDESKNRINGVVTLPAKDDTTTSEVGVQPPRHKHPLRHPKYPNGAPPPMCGAISYKGPPIAERRLSAKRGQLFMHWGCVQLPAVASSHCRRQDQGGEESGDSSSSRSHHMQGVRS